MKNVILIVVISAFILLSGCAHNKFDRSGICFTHKDVEFFQYQMGATNKNGEPVILKGGCFDSVEKVMPEIQLEYDGVEIEKDMKI